MTPTPHIPGAELAERLRTAANAVDLLDSGSRYTMSMRRMTKAILLEAAEALAARIVPEGWRCAKCDCRTFARMDTRLVDTSWGPGDFVRCVNCKDESFYPTANVPPQVNEAVTVTTRNEVPLAQWEDPRVQLVYEMMCDEVEPPPEEHWEGFLARRIIAALYASPSPGTATAGASDQSSEADTVALSVLANDPNAVHINLLRGSLARPSLSQIIHIYGAEALREALPSDQSRVERLETALKPFAEEADRIHPDWADERRRSTLTPSKELTVADFRRARQALRGDRS